MRMRLAILAAAVFVSTAAEAQMLGQRLPGQRAEPGMPRSGARSQGLRPCPQYGPGFFQLEGSTTCMRLGGSVGFEMGWQSNRSRYRSNVGTRAGATIELDARVPTGYGDVRAVVRSRALSDTGAMVGQPWR